VRNGAFEANLHKRLKIAEWARAHMPTRAHNRAFKPSGLKRCPGELERTLLTWTGNPNFFSIKTPSFSFLPGEAAWRAPSALFSVVLRVLG
jgi:hypothetical protein